LEDGGGIEADEEANVCHFQADMLLDVTLQLLTVHHYAEESITKEIIP